MVAARSSSEFISPHFLRDVCDVGSFRFFVRLYTHMSPLSPCPMTVDTDRLPHGPMHRDDLLDYSLVHTSRRLTQKSAYFVQCSGANASGHCWCTHRHDIRGRSRPGAGWCNDHWGATTVLSAIPRMSSSFLWLGCRLAHLELRGTTFLGQHRPIVADRLVAAEVMTEHPLSVDSEETELARKFETLSSNVKLAVLSRHSPHDVKNALRMSRRAGRPGHAARTNSCGLLHDWMSLPSSRISGTS